MNNQGSTSNPNTARDRDEEEKKKREGKGENKPSQSSVTGSYGKPTDDGGERDYGRSSDQQHR